MGCPLGRKEQVPEPGCWRCLAKQSNQKEQPLAQISAEPKEPEIATPVRSLDLDLDLDPLTSTPTRLWCHILCYLFEAAFDLHENEENWYLVGQPSPPVVCGASSSGRTCCPEPKKGVRSLGVALSSVRSRSHIVKIMQMREPFLRKRKKMSIQMGWQSIFPWRRRVDIPS